MNQPSTGRVFRFGRRIYHIMKENKRKGGIFLHVSILFFISILTTGLFTFITEKQLSDRSVKRGMERHAKQISEEVRRSVTEYPAYDWFLSYWYDHAGELEIEYDAEFSRDSITAEKSRLFSARHPVESAPLPPGRFPVRSPPRAMHS